MQTTISARSFKSNAITGKFVTWKPGMNYNQKTGKEAIALTFDATSRLTRSSWKSKREGNLDARTWEKKR